MPVIALYNTFRLILHGKKNVDLVWQLLNPAMLNAKDACRSRKNAVLEYSAHLFNCIYIYGS